MMQAYNNWMVHDTNELNLRKINKNMEEGDEKTLELECPICREEVCTHKEIVICQQCTRGNYHKGCIEKWLENRTICRHQLSKLQRSK